MRKAFSPTAALALGWFSAFTIAQAQDAVVPHRLPFHNPPIPCNARCQPMLCEEQLPAAQR